MNGISAFIKETLRGLPYPFHHVRTHLRQLSLSQEAGSQQTLNLHLDLRHSSLQCCEKQICCF